MAGTPQFPSGHNTFVPDSESTDNLRIMYSKNPKSWKFMSYCQLINVTKTDGYYWNMTNEQAGRINSLADVAWPSGADRPKGRGNTESFNLKAYRTERRAFTVDLDLLATEQSAWDMTQQYQRQEANRAMTYRAITAVSALTNTANYSASHVQDTATIPGNTGNLATANVSNQIIKRTINYCLNLLEVDSLSSTDSEEWMLVLAPTLASTLAQTGEIADYMKGSAYSGPVLKGEWGGKGNRGLPSNLYGLEVMVENASRAVGKRGGTVTKSYLMGNAVAAIVRRVGGLEAAEGPNFSSLAMFVYGKDDMAVEIDTDKWNRKMRVSISDNTDTQLIAPVSSMLLTNCQ